jgi:hypothetical protein
MHVVPFSAFDARLRLPLGRHIEWYLSFPPLASPHPQQYRINVDGLLTSSNAQADAKAQRAYVQVFHTGVVEAVASSFFLGDGTRQNPTRLTAMRTELCIVQYSHTYLRALISLGAAPPFALLVSLIGVKGVPYSFSDGGFDEPEILDRDQLHFSEVIIDDVPEDPYDHADLVRPLLDQIANAAGKAASLNFNNNGRFGLRVV